MGLISATDLDKQDKYESREKQKDGQMRDRANSKTFTENLGSGNMGVD